jgi:hypothetical protein
MNELAEQVQQAYESDGREGARTTFLTMVEERDWTRGELEEAADLMRSFPNS